MIFFQTDQKVQSVLENGFVFEETAKQRCKHYGGSWEVTVAFGDDKLVRLRVN